MLTTTTPDMTMTMTTITTTPERRLVAAAAAYMNVIPFYVVPAAGRNAPTPWQSFDGTLYDGILDQVRNARSR